MRKFFSVFVLNKIFEIYFSSFGEPSNISTLTYSCTFTEAYFGPCQTCAMELFCESSKLRKAINYFCKKTPS